MLVPHAIREQRQNFVHAIAPRCGFSHSIRLYLTICDPHSWHDAGRRVVVDPDGSGVYGWGGILHDGGVVDVSCGMSCYMQACHGC